MTMPQQQDLNTIESIAVCEFYESFKDKLKLELITGDKGLNKVIREKSINRPALALTGYFKFFANKRLQLFGAGEMAYLRDLQEDMQELLLIEIARKNIPCIVISRNLNAPKSMLKVASEFNVPLFRTPIKSKDFTAQATVLLEDKLAPRTHLHGTLMDVKGIGTLLRGSSGMGKSECALALIERGHSLVADDLTYIRLLADNELLGTSSDLNRGYMECRGIGIINIAELFGIRSVRLEKRIDIVVNFIEWHEGMDEERTGLEQSYFNILNVDVPLVEIPVRPGRDLARLTEVAALVQALKKMGHNSAREFNERLISYMTDTEAS